MNQKSNEIFVGLSESEALRQLEKDGYNELPSQKKLSGLATIFHILLEPMLLLLVCCAVLYFFMGEKKDAMMLLVSVLVVIFITYYQERKTEKTLETLKNLSSPRALVFRDGEQKRIPGKEVVKNDIIILREGDRVPADATILSCENLSIDESLLTGESMPVRKSEWNSQQMRTRPGGDDLPFVYSGSLIVNGHGIARVDLTGSKTEIGLIGKSLENIKNEETLLHKETSRIVKIVAFAGLFLCALVVAFYVVVKGNLIQGILSGLTLSMAILPEEFPVVLLIFLTLGAWRISKRNVLARRSAVIETLGAATVLCTDKTGTLTLNKMELASIYAGDLFYEIKEKDVLSIPENFHQLLEYAILASQKDPFDPIEKELIKKGRKYLKDTEHLHANWNIIKEYPLSKKLLALSNVWQSPDKRDCIIASKGAPEAILNLCHVHDGKNKEILEKVKEMTGKGLRVLAVAKAMFSADVLPKDQHDFTFDFVGLLGFIDPIRASVPEAIKEAYSAGMRVIMVTGDYAGTAEFIAKEIGLNNSSEYIIGDELEKMSHAELRERIKTVNIFARVVPEQKLLIIDALKANGEVVAMTGDGVNDAAALKAAHIGIAMGERGTDVAREAAGLVLLNDDFSSIVSAVRLGRRIYDNLKRAMGYILSVHVPIAGMSILPLIFDYPIVLLPAHVAFLELIIDPACSIVFESEKESEDIMKRRPRNIHEPLFNMKTVIANLSQGFGLLVAIFALFVFVVESGKGDLEARSFAFVSLVLASLILIVINLSWSKMIYSTIRNANRTLLIVLFGSLSSLLIILFVPFFADLFRLGRLHLNDLFLVGLVVFISVAWFEILKFFKKTPEL